MLARTAFATGPIQAALAAAGIPHRVLGSLGLYERAEVRDALAYLALLANPRDAHAFRRAVQAPRRGVGTATIGRVVAAARERFDGDLITTCANAAAARRRARRTPTRRRARRASAPASTPCAPQYRAGRSLGHVVVATLTLDGGLVAHHQARRDTLAARRRSAATASACSRTCARCAAPPRPTPTRSAPPPRSPASSSTPPACTPRRSGPARTAASPSPPSTAPRAPKPNSCCCSAARSSCCPPGARCESADPEDLEEERRLFYVAATRAKDHLVLTRCHVRGGRATGGPSRFLAEAGLDIAPARARRLTPSHLFHRRHSHARPHDRGRPRAARPHPRARRSSSSAARSRPARSAFAP